MVADAFFRIPSDPPLNITVHNKSSTSIEVTWNSIQSEHLTTKNISGYRVRLKKASNGTWQRDYFLCQTAQALLLENLQVYTKYCIIVATFPRNITRNSSQCLFTGEEGNVYFKYSRNVQCRDLKRCLSFIEKKNQYLFCSLCRLFFF